MRSVPCEEVNVSGQDLEQQVTLEALTPANFSNPLRAIPSPALEVACRDPFAR
jgi:hypothetical protein